MIQRPGIYGGMLIGSAFALLIGTVVLLSIWWTANETPRVTNELPPSVRNILEAAKRIELSMTTEDWPSNIDEFECWAPKRFATLVTQNERNELLKAIYAGVARHDGGVMPCSEPSYVLYAESHGESVGLAMDDCGRIQVYLNRKRITTIGTADDAWPILARHRNASR